MATKSLAQACIDAGFIADGPGLLKMMRAQMRARAKAGICRTFPDRAPIVEADTLTERQRQARAYIARWEEANRLRRTTVEFAEVREAELTEDR